MLMSSLSFPRMRTSLLEAHSFEELFDLLKQQPAAEFNAHELIDDALSDEHFDQAQFEEVQLMSNCCGLIVQWLQLGAYICTCSQG